MLLLHVNFHLDFVSLLLLSAFFHLLLLFLAVIVVVFCFCLTSLVPGFVLILINFTVCLSPFLPFAGFLLFLTGVFSFLFTRVLTFLLLVCTLTIIAATT